MISIIFASQTGTAQDVALELAFAFKQKGWNSRVRSTQNLTIQEMKQLQICIFLISTTGDGEPTDSFVRLWAQLLNKSLPKDLLHFRFSVFGFGDSKYGDNFNVMARKLEKRLTMLGGKVVAQRGLGDQQDKTGYRSQFKVWLDALLSALSEEELQTTTNPNYFIQNSLVKSEYLKVNKITYLQQQPQRTTYFVQFQTDLINQPGDILTIYPKNKQQDVKLMLKYFNLDGTQTLTKQGVTAESYKIFKQIVNISDTAPYLIFNRLHEYIEDQFLKNKLVQFKSNYLEYHEYVKQFRRSIVEILQDFPVKINLDYFLEVINFIKPRKYSIASSRKGVICLLIRLVEYDVTPYRKIFGALSKGILSEGKGSLWRGYVTQGKFKFKPNEKYFMVGVGTGIAPFISFFDRNESASFYLNFGNRNQKQFYLKDYLYQKSTQGNLVVRVAFSRDQSQKMHVQELFKHNQQEIKNFFNTSNPNILICGPYSNFAESIVIALQKALDFSDEKIKQMKKNSQILSQCW